MTSESECPVVQDCSEAGCPCEVMEEKKDGEPQAGGPSDEAIARTLLDWLQGKELEEGENPQVRAVFIKALATFIIAENMKHLQ